MNSGVFWEFCRGAKKIASRDGCVLLKSGVRPIPWSVCPDPLLQNPDNTQLLISACGGLFFWSVRRTPSNLGNSDPTSDPSGPFLVYLFAYQARGGIFLPPDWSVATKIAQKWPFSQILEWKWPQKKGQHLVHRFHLLCFSNPLLSLIGKSPVSNRLRPNIWAKLWLQIS